MKGTIAIEGWMIVAPSPSGGVRVLTANDAYKIYDVYAEAERDLQSCRRQFDSRCEIVPVKASLVVDLPTWVKQAGAGT